MWLFSKDEETLAVAQNIIFCPFICPLMVNQIFSPHISITGFVHPLIGRLFGWSVCLSVTTFFEMANLVERSMVIILMVS